MDHTEHADPSAPVAAPEADLDIQAEAIRAVQAVKTLRPMRYDVQVAVQAGRVTLSGVVPSPMAATEAQRAVAALPGVTAVDNQLFDDGRLSYQVAYVLGSDPRTRGLKPGYQVVSMCGLVKVIGRLDAAQAALVVEVARSVPGVRAAQVNSIG